MRIVVSGGSGFIGSRLVERLLEAGHEVRIFDKAPSARFNHLVTRGDVRDAAALSSALKGADAVYQLAAEHRDDVSPTSLYYEVNVEGARNTVAAAREQGLRRIVFTSSVAIYGLNKGAPRETSSADPFNHYGKSKLQAEQLFREWQAQGQDVALTIVRPVVVFGEGNRGNVHNLIQQIRSKRFMMIGSGRNKKSMAYVGNVAAFLEQALALGRGLHVFNYADKPDLTVAELVALVREEMKITSPLVRVPYPVGLAGGYLFDALARVARRTFPVSGVRVRKFCAETTVATDSMEALGFRREFTIEEGLRRMIRAE